MATSTSQGSSTSVSSSSRNSSAHLREHNSSTSDSDGDFEIVPLQSEYDDENTEEEFKSVPGAESVSQKKRPFKPRPCPPYTLHGGPMPLASLQPALAVLAQREFGGNAMNKLTFIMKDVKVRKNGTSRRIGYCSFHNETNCPYRIACTVAGDSATIHIGGWPHSHEAARATTKGPSKRQRQILSPSKKNQKPAQLLHAALQVDGNMDQTDHRGFKAWVSHAKRGLAYHGIPQGHEHTYGAIATKIAQCKLVDATCELFDHRIILRVTQIHARRLPSDLTKCMLLEKQLSTLYASA